MTNNSLVLDIEIAVSQAIASKQQFFSFVIYMFTATYTAPTLYRGNQ